MQTLVWEVPSPSPILTQSHTSMASSTNRACLSLPYSSNQKSKLYNEPPSSATYASILDNCGSSPWENSFMPIP
ncbi:hypothetical protein VIGAN_08252200 [Vigna angularis var. angularis]|uniref:Uncharacterized protein n=1 Tax=Vigna angularis var. angularis TaxID=157739 RepID=A0A0S3SSE9_PHAAN|nr:hypothetical protein VIGAN_08252200 [Vigna angularis var. angularis]